MPTYYIPKNEFKVVTDEEIKPYIDKASKAMKALLAIAYLTGARISEILLIRKKDILIDYEKEESQLKIITLKRAVPVVRQIVLGFKDPFVVDILIPYVSSKMKDEGRLFKRCKRTYQMKLMNLNKLIHGDDSNKYITFHYLRHSAITHIARRENATPWEIQAFTGHKSSAYDDYMIISAPIRFKNRMSHSSTS